MGVSGPTRHANSLSSLLNKAPPCIGNLNHFFSDQRFIVEAARVQPRSASETSQCVGMYLTEEACQSVRGLPSEFRISAGDEVRLTAGEVEESCGSATQIAVREARCNKAAVTRDHVLLASSGK